MNENINKLSTAVYVLNHIETAGKQNLLNLGGAIGIIEEVIESLKETGQTDGDESE